MIMQNFGSMGVVTIVWFIVGFSLCFGKTVGGTVTQEITDQISEVAGVAPTTDDPMGGVIGNPATFFFFNGVTGHPLSHEPNVTHADYSAIVEHIPGLTFAGYRALPHHRPLEPAHTLLSCLV